MQSIIRQAQDAAGLIGDDRVKEIAPGGLSAASAAELDLIIREGDEAFIASAADVGSRALDARRLGVVTASTAALITGFANDAVYVLKEEGDRDGAIALLNDARGMLDGVA